MTNKPLIGLIGKARVGKDTAAEYICEQYGLATYSFADPVKQMLEPVFGDLFYGGDREQPIEWLGKSPRQLMQTLGTEWGRQQHPDLWVLLADQFWKTDNYAQAAGLVVTDVRFHNEADWILQSGGVLIEVVREGAEQVNAHSSESATWEGTPRIVVENNGDISDLYETLDGVMNLSDWRLCDVQLDQEPVPQEAQGRRGLRHGCPVQVAEAAFDQDPGAAAAYLAAHGYPQLLHS